MRHTFKSSITILLIVLMVIGSSPAVIASAAEDPVSHPIAEPVSETTQVVETAPATTSPTPADSYRSLADQQRQAAEERLASVRSTTSTASTVREQYANTGSATTSGQVSTQEHTAAGNTNLTAEAAAGVEKMQQAHDDTLGVAQAAAQQPQNDVIEAQQQAKAEASQASGNALGASNYMTGADSTNISSNTQTTNVGVTNVNVTEYQSEFDISLNTGGNTVFGVNGDVSLHSGDIGLLYSETGIFNINQTNVSDALQPGGGYDGDASNSLTGANSTNIALTDSNQTIVIDNSNILQIDQSGNLDINTGSNAVSSVNGNTTIGSGSADLAVNLINMGNVNVNGDANMLVENYDIYDEHHGNLVINFGASDVGAASGAHTADFNTASNDTTGSGSYNEAGATQSKNTTIINFNQADIDQSLAINVDTGNNSGTGINGDTSIESGDINIAVNILNFANANLYNVDTFVLGTVNIYGDMYGDIVLPNLSGGSGGSTANTGGSVANFSSNDMTGADSTNIATSTDNFDVGVTNNNELDVAADINFNLETGNNQIADLNGGLGMDTGDVNASATLNTIGNINSTNLGGGDEDVFWLILVNDVSGNWDGAILGFDGNAAVSGGYMIMSMPVENTASNSNTQSGSTNLATASSSDSLQLENNNEASIYTNLSINANTGGNSLQSINGDTGISTGDINANAMITNLSNFNFTGKKVVILIVNIFGNFFGDIIPDGYAKDDDDNGGGGPQPDEPEKPVDEKPVDEKPVDEKPVDEKPVDEKPVDEKPVDEKPVDEKPVDEKPVDEKPEPEVLGEKDIVVIPPQVLGAQHRALASTGSDASVVFFVLGFILLGYGGWMVRRRLTA